MPPPEPLGPPANEESGAPAAGVAAGGLGRATWIVLAAGLLLGIVRISVLGLSDPSEGRYAQIAREMVDEGAWLIPKWYGVVHLEKPPLAYWCAAAGITVFGRNEFAVRVVPMLLLLATALLTARIARRVGGSRTAAAAAAAAVCLAPYPVAAGEALLTDGFNLFAAALFWHAVLLYADRGRRATLLLAAVALAIGMLSKGYVIFLFTLLPLLLVRPRLVRDVLRPRPLVLFLALTVPWFVLVYLRYPAFFSEQVTKLVRFSTSGADHHRAPFVVYAVNLLAGLFPFSLYAWRGARALPRPWSRPLLSWLLVPFVILTLMPSRTWTYILPAVPPLAVLGGLGLPAHARRLRVVAGFGLAAAGALLWLVAPMLPVGKDFDAATVRTLALGLFACGLWALATRRRGLLAPAGLTAMFTLALVLTGLLHEPPFHIHRKIAREAERAAGDEHPVVILGINCPSVAFYLDEPVTATKAGGRLLVEAEKWGDSDTYEPEKTSLSDALAEGAVVVTHERVRSVQAPDLEPLFRDGPACVLFAGESPQKHDSPEGGEK